MGCLARMLASGSTMRPRMERSFKNSTMTKGQIFQTGLQGSFKCSVKLQIHPYLQQLSTAILPLPFFLEANILITFHIFATVADRLQGGHHCPQRSWRVHIFVSSDSLECVLPTNRIWQRGWDVTPMIMLYKILYCQQIQSGISLSLHYSL